MLIKETRGISTPQFHHLLSNQPLVLFKYTSSFKGSLEKNFLEQVLYYKVKYEVYNRALL